VSRLVSLAVAPDPIPGLAEALEAAGAELVEPASAEAIVWTSPGQPDRLAALLEPRHRWVALVIAGVERWLAAGVVDDSRVWTCARGVYADGVAEHALALVLAAARRLPACARAESWRQLDTERLRGETVTILGAGAIGGRLAGLLAPLGARLVAVTRHGAPLPGFERTYPSSALREALSGVRYLVVTAALTDATRGIVDGAVLDTLGPRGVLVNVARGELVDTEALVERLRDGRLGAALLDVTDPEPLPDGHPLWSLDNVLVTPHVANPNAGNPWDSHLPELLEHLADNVRAFADDRPLAGTIDVAAGY
jgi:D-3-phosphoglycerate dehydrogenase